MRLGHTAQSSQPAFRLLPRANSFARDIDKSALELLEKHVAPPLTYFFQK
jgi:hypothetical protein